MDKTPQEEREKIFAQLPEAWRQKIINEESKRRGKQLWVRISGPDLTSMEALELVGEVCGEGEKITLHETDLRTTYEVRCPTEDMRRKLKARDNTAFKGRTVRVITWKVKMGAKEIFEFVLQRLKDLEEGRYGDCYSEYVAQEYRGRPRDR